LSVAVRVVLRYSEDIMNESNLEKIPHSVLVEIRALYNSLKSAERKFVDYILGNPDRVHGSTIVDLADKAGCSEATIVRLSKKLGFKGFPELKEAFGAQTDEERPFDYEGIRSSDDSMTVVSKVFNATHNALNDTFELLAREEYDRAVDALLSASKIVFCGLGDAGVVATEAYYRFTRIGENCLVSEDPDLQLIQAAHMKKGDVMVVISHTGRSRTILDAVKEARKHEATIVLITNFPVSPLAKHADILLRTAVFSKQFTDEVISKRVTELCIIESLYINYLIKKGMPTLERLKRSNDSVKVNKLGRPFSPDAIG